MSVGEEPVPDEASSPNQLGQQIPTENGQESRQLPPHFMPETKVGINSHRDQQTSPSVKSADSAANNASNRGKKNSKEFFIRPKVTYIIMTTTANSFWQHSKIY